MPPVSVVECHDLSVTLGGLPVLRRVDLDIGAGQCVGILGPNGSGKSTLVKSLLGLLPASRGGVRLFDTDVARFRRWERIGYVPQRSTLTMQSAAVGEVVASGLLAGRRPFVPVRGARDRTRRALERVGLADRDRDALITLSGGQQQRVLIARGLVARPDLLVLDEPLAGVDSQNQERVGDIAARFLAEGGTVVVVLHETATFGPLLDRAVVLQDGRIIQDGPPAGLPFLGRHEHDSGGDHAADGWFSPHTGHLGDTDVRQR